MSTTPNSTTTDTVDDTIVGSDPTPSRLGWRLAWEHPKMYAIVWVGWLTFYLLPLGVGLMLKRVFDAIERGEPFGGWLAGYLGIEVAKWIVFTSVLMILIRWWALVEITIRTNLLDAQTVSGGPSAATLPHSPSEAISRFRDDVRDVVVFIDSWLDGFGVLLVAFVGIAVLAQIHLVAAFVTLIPLVVVTGIAVLLLDRVQEARENDRRATGEVSSHLGESMVAATTVRTAGAEGPTLARLSELTSVRRTTAVRDQVLTQAINGLASTTSEVTIGLTLLVIVGAVRSEALGLGDVALFVTYAATMAAVPRFTARIVTSHRQAGVSFGRFAELLPPGRLADVARPRPLDIERTDIEPPLRPDPERTRLEVLELQSVSSIHPGTDLGVHDIDLVIPAGTLNVVTGDVGSGKSTLLRAIVGLLPLDSGAISWNGEVIDDPAAFFVPPNAAHVPQVPRLFTDSLETNVLLGRDLGDGRLAEAMALAAVDDDVAQMPEGQATLLGPRGVRLSGGQTQRVATARSLVTRPELLVVDDLSSALDVDTERRLWDGLLEDGAGGQRGQAVIAVSHRRLAMERADQIVVLSRGRIIAQGTHAELRASGHLPD